MSLEPDVFNFPAYGPQRMRFDKRLAAAVAPVLRDWPGDGQRHHEAVEWFYMMVNADLDAGNERRKAEALNGERST